MEDPDFEPSASGVAIGKPDDAPAREPAETGRTHREIRLKIRPKSR